MGKHWDEAVESILKVADSPYCMPIIAAQLREAAKKLKPSTRTVEVWTVEHAVKLPGGWLACTSTFDCEDKAREAAETYRNAGHRCIRITGPHKRQVPA